MAARRPPRLVGQRARRRPARRRDGRARLGPRHALPALPPAGRARGLGEAAARADGRQPARGALRRGWSGTCASSTRSSSTPPRPGRRSAELEDRGRGRRRAGIAAVGAGSVSAAVLGLQHADRRPARHRRAPARRPPRPDPHHSDVRIARSCSGRPRPPAGRPRGPASTAVARLEPSAPAPRRRATAALPSRPSLTRWPVTSVGAGVGPWVTNGSRERVRRRTPTGRTARPGRSDEPRAERTRPPATWPAGDDTQPLPGDSTAAAALAPPPARSRTRGRAASPWHAGPAVRQPYGSSRRRRTPTSPAAATTGLRPSPQPGPRRHPQPAARRCPGGCGRWSRSPRWSSACSAASSAASRSPARCRDGAVNIPVIGTDNGARRPLDADNGSVAAVAEQLLPSTVQIQANGGADGTPGRRDRVGLRARRQGPRHHQQPRGRRRHR